VVTAPFAAREHGLRDLLHREVREVRSAAEGAAADEKRTFGPHLLADKAKLIVAQVLRRDVDEVALGRVTMNPKHFAIRRIAEALELAHRLGKHLRVVLLADDPVAPLVLLEKRRRELVEAEATAALPSHSLGDATRVVTR